MIPQVQSRVGEDGTCFRAALASIFNCAERQVPDFSKAGDGSEEAYWNAVQRYLAKKGLRYRRVPADGAKPFNWHTIEGISPRGGLHAVVGYQGKIVWDPHPKELNDGQGLVEQRWFGLLEPLQKKITDRSDMLKLRKNTERQGGPFFIQETTKSGAERTIPVRRLAKGADARMTVAGANAALRAAGYKERLVRGNGYYYFVDGDACRWFSSSIQVNNIGSMTAADIIRKRNLLANDYHNS